MSVSAIQSQVISAGAAAGTVVSAWALSAQMGRGQQPPGPGKVPSPASARRHICITAQHIIKDTIVI